MTEWTSDFDRLAPNNPLGASSAADIQRLSHYFDAHWPNVHLRLISEQFDSAFSDEQACFDTIHSDFWIRKIFLCSDETPLSYGRVIVPKSTYLRFQKDFDQLKTKPIGETLLHHNPQVKRYPFEYRFLEKTDPLSKDTQLVYPKLNTPSWARRSLFTWEGFPLLITEVFLFQTQVSPCP
jgi:chorismate--pyruvate lyase